MIGEVISCLWLYRDCPLVRVFLVPCAINPSLVTLLPTQPSPSMAEGSGGVKFRRLVLSIPRWRPSGRVLPGAGDFTPRRVTVAYHYDDFSSHPHEHAGHSHLH